MEALRSLDLSSKIEVGDSLTGAEPSGGFELDIAWDDRVSRLEGFKANLSKAHGEEKEGPRG